MKLYRSIPALLLICFCVAAPATAQQTEAERKALDELTAKANKGDAETQLQLGNRYATGDGVTKDPAKAFKWHRKAGEQGLARAELALGLDYLDGTGVKPDQAEALGWFQKSANQGLAEAQLELGRFYATGNGTSEWPVEAAKWFRKAAEQGLAGAQFELGNCCFEGTGVTKDIAEGVKWIRKAANQGSAAAQHKLGLCYTKGDGVQKDNLLAYVWLNLAAAQGDQGGVYAKMDLVKVEHLLTPDQVIEAQRLSREFKPGQSSFPESSTDLAIPSAANATTGFVNVKADDETCEIFADGAFVGNSPAKLRLTEGSHVIEVKKSGFKDFRRELRVTAGSDLTLRVILDKQ